MPFGYVFASNGREDRRYREAFFASMFSTAITPSQAHAQPVEEKIDGGDAAVAGDNEVGSLYPPDPAGGPFCGLSKRGLQIGWLFCTARGDQLHQSV